MERITLKTLPQATAQQVFDQVAVHLLFQNEQSALGNFFCRYRIGSLSCAAGCLIADDEYDLSFEARGWNRLVAGKVVPNTHQKLIENLQDLHDYRPVQEWRKFLKELAVEQNLEFDDAKIDAEIALKRQLKV